MAIFKCKMCGGALEIQENATVATCEYCGTQQTLSKTKDEVIANLFNRANNLRLKCEFDRAEQVYESILQRDETDAEAHWGMVLCKYGIEYVDDPGTGKKIPTCHRTLFEAVTADVDYQAALDYSDSTQQSMYEAEARAIDRIQRGILEIVKNEKPFDVFICYKESDANGKRTVDSVIANDIYHQLTQEGLKVFYAAITLEDKLGQEYEPYIFAALNSAKAMLVLGTKPEYFTAVWVKNEWSRFQKLMKTDRSRILIPCFRDMDAYDLPEDFAHLQAQDMSKIGFINDVVRGIKKVVGAAAPKEEAVSGGEVRRINTEVDATVSLGVLALNSGSIDKAAAFFEDALRLSPNHIGAYIGLIRTMESNAAAPYAAKIRGYELSEIADYLKKYPDILGETATNAATKLLLKAIYNIGDADIISTILDAGAKPDPDSLYGAIVTLKDPDVVRMLLQNGADPNWEYRIEFKDGSYKSGYEKRSALCEAIFSANNLGIVELLADNGADLNYMLKYIKYSHPRDYCTYEVSVLNLAVRWADVEIVKYLAEYGANLDVGRIEYHGDVTARTSNLSDAFLARKSMTITKLLIEAGADPNVAEVRYLEKDDYGYDRHRGYFGYGNTSPLINAIFGTADTNLVKLLLDAGANPKQVYECRMGNGYRLYYLTKLPALGVAVYSEKEEMVRLLLEAGASFEELVHSEEQDPDRFSADNYPLKKEAFNDRMSDSLSGLIAKHGWAGRRMFAKSRSVYYFWSA